MSASNSTAFPVLGQALRIRFAVFNATSGLLVTGGLTGIAATISQNDGSAIATANSPVESGMPGVAYLDLTAAEMNADGIVVNLTVTNTNGFALPKEIVPLRLAEQTGAALDQTIILFEQVVLDIMACAINSGDFTGYNQQVNKRNGVLKFQGTYNAAGGTSTRNNLA